MKLLLPLVALGGSLALLMNDWAVRAFSYL
jgi:hypothetical protein